MWASFCLLVKRMNFCKCLGQIKLSNIKQNARQAEGKGLCIQSKPNQINRHKQNSISLATRLTVGEAFAFARMRKLFNGLGLYFPGPTNTMMSHSFHVAPVLCVQCFPLCTVKTRETRFSGFRIFHSPYCLEFLFLVAMAFCWTLFGSWRDLNEQAPLPPQVSAEMRQSEQQRCTFEWGSLPRRSEIARKINKFQFTPIAMQHHTNDIWYLP